ncbi:MAG: sRNA-binding carbon storage regulator CsrA [Porticoccus sp.]|jgi:sRNA-binding carbon storage regulator CsrA|uniref:carbon storage regulator n=1 Tax=Porticoccus sp. TaxID=2024853 RepID=UPI0039E47103|tara:strand:- start:167 stop:349 length:183 start_codon:yes stop_codon:yes gene_type:complete
MLKIRRKSGEVVVLNTADGRVRIEFVLDGRQIKLAIDAPDVVEVLRGELQNYGIKRKQLF